MHRVSKAIPKASFHQDYPTNPQTFGEALRKARMDAGLQIKELADEIGVNEMSVINWELRGMMPRYPEKVLGRLPSIQGLEL